MRGSTVQDQMTRDVVTVGVDTPYKQIAQLLAESRVSGLPVVDPAGHVVGVVTEADLLAREEYPDEQGRRRPVLPLPGASRRRKAAAGTAGELMSTPAITMEDRTSVVRAAREMDRHRIKRLPVVDEVGRLVGIVSRRDLLKIFLRSDDEIRAEIETEVLEESLGIAPGIVSVKVADGLVTLEGRVQRRTLIPVVVRLAHAADGVIDVVDRLDYDIDDTKVTEVTYNYWRDPAQ
jgi:CBS domain-containing protein